jgi:Synergist-CTERM protein sorting domain-containing protein
MKVKSKILALILAIAVLWSGAASADLFYTVVDSGYSNGSAGVATRDGSSFNALKDLVTGIGGDTGVHTFIDTGGNERILLRNYTYSSSDAVSIYDPSDLTAPIFNSTAWTAGNIKGAVSLGDHLYVTAALRNYTSMTAYDSGELLKIRMSDYQVVARYQFSDMPGGGKRNIDDLRAYGGKLYVVSNNYNPVTFAYEDCEVFRFSPANISAPEAWVTIGINAGAMSKPLDIYGSNLYIACAGNSSAPQKGSLWSIDMSSPSMTATELIDFDNVTTTGFSFNSPKGIAFADDGTALIAVGDDWNPGAIYRTSAALLASGGNADAKAGTRIGTFTPAASGYTFGVAYDRGNATFWVGNGSNLEARDRNGALLKSFTPAELGDNMYAMTVIGKYGDSSGDGTPGGDNQSTGGGGCDAGFGAISLIVAVLAVSLKRRKR